MAYYMMRRGALSLLVLFITLFVVFLMVNAIGDPALLMLPPGASEEQYQALRERLGLNEPLITRMMTTFPAWLTGDFGMSLWQNVPALDLALSRVPATLYLTAVVIAIAVPSALALGYLAVLRGPNSFSDRVVTTLSIGAASMPTFWLGLMLILIFAVQLGLLPTSGYGGIAYVILPALALAAVPTGRLAQVARSSLFEEMQKPYVVTLRAKGLDERQIILGHGLKNAAIPVVTLLGNELAALVNGAVVIEAIFNWPGIGQLFLQAILNRDLPLVSACVFVVAVMTIAINLLVDLSYAFFDPRATLVRTR